MTSPSSTNTIWIYVLNEGINIAHGRINVQNLVSSVFDKSICILYINMQEMMGV